MVGPIESDAPTFPIERDPKLRLLIPVIVAIGFGMEGLDTTIITTAIPAMAKALQSTPLQMSLVVTTYVLVLAVFIPVSGWFADRFSARRVFAAALLTFTAGSVLCGLAIDLPMLVAAAGAAQRRDQRRRHAATAQRQLRRLTGGDGAGRVRRSAPPADARAFPRGLLRARGRPFARNSRLLHPQAGGRRPRQRPCPPAQPRSCRPLNPARPSANARPDIAIRAKRKPTNRLIAAHDAARLRPHLTPSATKACPRETSPRRSAGRWRSHGQQAA
jgi:hypothetical protein